MTTTERIFGALVIVVLGVLLLMTMAHWAACEQYEGFCSWSQQ